MGDANSLTSHEIVKHSNDSIIFVNIQCRLGAYGFLGSEAYIASGGAPNAGLLDHRAALDWVHSYISAFGGVPNRVTIMGGSAGGRSVLGQLIMYEGVQNPPFRAAISKLPWQLPLNEKQLAKQHEYLLKVTNCTSMECLKALPEAVLKNATQATYPIGYAEGQ